MKPLSFFCLGAKNRTSPTNPVGGVRQKPRPPGIKRRAPRTPPLVPKSCAAAIPVLEAGSPSSAACALASLSPRVAGRFSS